MNIAPQEVLLCFNHDPGELSIECATEHTNVVVTPLLQSIGVDVCNGKMWLA